MKLAVSGKGGVGKTTIAAALALLFAKEGKGVYAIDCDPDSNLAQALGYAGEITPITGMKELIAERAGEVGGYFKLNPKVDDIPQKFSVRHRGVKILSMGKVKGAGAGCLCPENAFVRNLLAHLVLNEDDVVIMDMVAGSEHLGRATAASVDAMLIVVEPDERSVETAKRIQALAEDLGIKRIALVGNKVRSEDDRKFIIAKAASIDALGFINFDDGLLRGRAAIADDCAIFEQVNTIKDGIERWTTKKN